MAALFAHFAGRHAAAAKPGAGVELIGTEPKYGLGWIRWTHGDLGVLDEISRKPVAFQGPFLPAFVEISGHPSAGYLATYNLFAIYGRTLVIPARAPTVGATAAGACGKFAADFHAIFPVRRAWLLDPGGVAGSGAL